MSNHTKVSALAMFSAIFIFSSGCGRSTTSAESQNEGVAVAQGPVEEFGLSPARLTARVEETEQLIGSCMRDSGFNYIPVDFTTIKEAMASDQSAPGLNSDEYLKQFGLGVTTQFDKPIITFKAGPANNAIADALPDADQVAFRRALWGSMPDWNHVRALEEEDFSQAGGCTRSAAEQSYLPAELQGTYINPADKKIEADSRVVAATRKWAECMRAEGFEYDNPNQIEEDLLQRLSVVTQGRDPRTLTGSAIEALKELQGRELAVAALHLSCEEEHLEAVVAKVETELFGGLTT